MSSRYAALYAVEAREQLAAATRAALALERSGGDARAGAEHVDALFRAVHTLKGMAGAMGYASVEALAHEAESVLARVRAGALAATPAVIDALLDAADALDVASERAVTGEETDVAEHVARLRAAAEATADETSPATPDADRHPEPALPSEGSRCTSPATTPGALRVCVTIAPDAPLPAVRAFMLLRAAQSLGAVDGATPDADALARGECDGTVTFRLATAATDEEVEQALRGVGDVAAIEVRAADAPHPVIPSALPVIPSALPVIPSAARDLDVDTELPRSAAPARNDGAARAEGAQRGAAVRVDLARLDALVDLAGELSIARAALAATVNRLGDPSLAAAVADVGRLVGALQEEALAVRMAPVGEAFDRLPRIVRDSARALDKQAALVVEGADVPLDRAILDHLAEPLAHLLRNAVAHGIEAPDERAARGKPAEGRIVLTAARDRDAVSITVADDGRGVDRAAVLERARSRGLVDAGKRDLTDDELLRCIASPGLSTSAEVTRVSGRGVGVDAVINALRALGGTLALRTAEGEGSRFLLRLPVTLAVTRALLVEDAGERYALPLTHVRETADLHAAQLRTVRGREVFVHRAEVLPLLRLGRVLGAPRANGGAGEVAIVEAGGRAAAVAVDAFLGQHDLVVKRLPAVRGSFRIFGGATILEDGAPALILDAPALLHHSLS